MQKEQKEEIETKEIKLEEESEKSVESNLDELDAMQTSKQIESKPQFQKMEKVRIAEAKLMTRGNKQEDKQGKQFVNHYLSIKFEYGQKWEKTYYQTFNGVRQYNDRKWLGPACKLAELKRMLEQFLEVKAELGLKQFVEELPGKYCMVKSKDYSYGKETVMRNDVLEFVEDKDE